MRPAVVWAKADAAPAAAPTAAVPAPAEPASAEPAPTEPAPAVALTRRELRARAAQAASLAPVAEQFELLEPVAAVEVEAPETETIEAEAIQAEQFTAQSETPQASLPLPEFDTDLFGADDFEAAARLFSFTGETPLQTDPPSADADAPAEPTEQHTKKLRRVKPAGSSFRRMATTSFSIGAMAVAGLLAVGMTTPTGAVASAAAAPQNPATSVLAGDAPVEAEDIQAYVAPAQVENVAIEREEGYAIASLADMAKADGINHTSSLYWNDPTAAIQWPFPVGVPMSFGWGMRWGRMHTGIDLTPGNGAKIQAIADGVVRSASNATGGYGVNIYIDHIIDGRVITSHYAHMQYGSMRVSAGDHVKVGDIIGVVGNTGHSFGAHLHFEILVQGTLVDPLSWMRKNANRMSLG